MDLVEKKIKDLESEKRMLNNAAFVLRDVSSEVKSKVYAAINSANESESIDGRIQALVAGMQSIIDFLNTHEENFLKQNFLVDTKMSVLEEVIDEYINTQTNENEQE